jgi:hypothetical protein
MAFTLKHGVILVLALALGAGLYYGGAAWATKKVAEFKPKEVVVYRPDPQQAKHLQQMDEERQTLLRNNASQLALIADLKNQLFTLQGSVEQEKTLRQTAEARIRDLEQTVATLSRPDKPEAMVIVNPDEPDHEVREIIRNQGLKGFTKRNAIWVVDEWFPAAELSWPPPGIRANLEVNGNVLAAKGDSVTQIRVKYRVAGLGIFDQDCYIKNGLFFAYFDRNTKLLNLVPR